MECKKSRASSFLLVAFSLLALGNISVNAQSQTEPQQLAPTQADSPKTTENSGADIEQPIVVIAPEKFKKVIAKYIDEVLVTPRGGKFNGQYARFNTKICPKAYGFSDENGQIIQSRIRSVAGAAKIPLDKADCTPNLFVVVVDDGPDVIAFLRKKKHRIFGEMQIYERNKLQNDSGPVYGWQTILTTPPFTGASAENNGADFTDSVNVSGGSSISGASLITVPSQRNMSASFVLIRRDALVGLTTTQIADFAAVRGLTASESKNVNFESAESILSLFNEGSEELARPANASLWDVALLNALYHSPSNMRAIHQRGIMIGLIKSSIKPTPPSQEDAAVAQQ